jgi:hypothetical protein
VRPKPNREASVEITVKNITEALQLANANQWPNGIPVVKARVRLAINSLLAHDRDLFKKTPEDITKTLRQPKNKGIRKILKDTSTASVAFAIYAALN